jgi:hypothetical protein
MVREIRRAPDAPAEGGSLTQQALTPGGLFNGAATAWATPVPTEQAPAVVKLSGPA